jgi:antitoxin (DNA-binding transcriptional repressor) of toxin-antitoxin stability system
MTETEASREFVSMMREVANGETVMITSDDGAPVARITPESSTAINGLTETMEKYPLPPEAVDDLERTIREHREWVGEGMREWPTD